MVSRASELSGTDAGTIWEYEPTAEGISSSGRRSPHHLRHIHAANWLDIRVKSPASVTPGPVEATSRGWAWACVAGWLTALPYAGGRPTPRLSSCRTTASGRPAGKAAGHFRGVPDHDRRPWH